MSGTEEVKAVNVEESIAERNAKAIASLDEIHLGSIKLGEELIDEINKVMKENYEFLIEKKKKLDNKQETPEEAYKWANDYIKEVEDRAADGQRRIDINVKYLLDIKGTPDLIEDEMKMKKDKILEMQKEKEDLEKAIKRQEDEIKEKEEYLKKLESDSNRKEWIEQRLREIEEMEVAEKGILESFQAKTLEEKIAYLVDFKFDDSKELFRENANNRVVSISLTNDNTHIFACKN